MAQSNVKAAILTSFDSSTLTGNYQSMNPNGLPGASFKIIIHNDSNVAVTVSYDGVDDNEIVFGTTTLVLEFQTNAQPSSNTALLAKGTQVYLKGTAGMGNIYLSAYYV